MQTLISLAEDFNLEKILKYKPFFFFFSSEPTRTILHNGAPLTIDFAQKKQTLELLFSREIERKDANAITKRVAFCLGANENLSDFYTMAKNDKVLKRFDEQIYGNRLLSAYDNFEALVSIIASQNVTFLQYKKMVGKIIELLGKGVYFPNATEIIQKKELLKNCGLGYRTKFIESVAEYMTRKKNVDVDSLYRINGIGPYSLDIFRLFQLRDYNYFYVDVLTKKIFKENYGFDWQTDKDIRDFAKQNFGKFQGLTEIYLQKFLNDN